MANVVGVVGAGGISRFHFGAFEKLGTEVRVVCDLDRTRAEPYLQTFGAEFAESYEAVVQHPDVQAVVVLSSSAMHYEIAKAALENGKHVICEKTLTLSAAESLELGRLAERKGLLLFTSYMKRFFPAARQARELMGRLGHITSVYCRTYQGVGTDIHTGEIPGGFRPNESGGSGVMRLAGGGILVCGGSHILDLLCFLVGKPVSVYGRRLVRPGCDVDFMFHALMDLPAGGVVHFEGNWHALRKIGYEGRGWDEGFEISGTRGRLILQTPLWCHPENNPARLSHYDDETEQWTRYAFDIVDPFLLAETHFQEQIALGEQGEQDRYTGYRVDELIETAWRSAGEGRPLELDWKDEVRRDQAS
ncbi:MAG TPA: Gfo/Idh/MocA family oxidoreductase [Phycisphaerae bacterium]|nr:Gfo/Idh/MocA family oxidoreductase [Phycisphaerae bacterium]